MQILNLSSGIHPLPWDSKLCPWVPNPARNEVRKSKATPDCSHHVIWLGLINESVIKKKPRPGRVRIIGMDALLLPGPIQRHRFKRLYMSFLFLSCTRRVLILIFQRWLLVQSALPRGALLAPTAGLKGETWTNRRSCPDRRSTSARTSESLDSFLVF